MTSTKPQDLGQPLLLEDYIPVPSPVTAFSPPLCAICHKTGTLQRCSACKDIYYCSSICQTTDWPSHKLLCKQYTASSRPDPSYRRALYLPDKSDKPRFMWLQYSDDGMPKDKMKAFPGVDAREVNTIGFHNQYLSYWLQVSYDGNVSRRALVENLCVQRLLGEADESNASTGAAGPGHSASSAAVASTWRGPLVVIAYDAEEGLSKPALDVDTGALRPLMEYLRLRKEYVGPVFVEQPQERWSEGELKKVLDGKGKE